MKKLFILALVLIPQLCFADMYVLLDKQTKEVLSASEKNDTVPAEGQEIQLSWYTLNSIMRNIMV